ncbi:MAG: transcription antitermination factor NusB [Elusimicrobiales bacterium]|nr:transcription antitermination factor NusB [Elusimicrobiales bacterium]
MSKRRLARENCLQSLYEIDIAHFDAESVIESFARHDASKDESGFAFYKELFSSTINHIEQIDEIISGVSKNWDIERMPAVDRSILRMAVCEMMILASAPVAVVIDEAIEMAKKYSTDNSGRFVNGVLDNIARHHKLLK